jgi:hypothetical protein
MYSKGGKVSAVTLTVPDNSQSGLHDGYMMDGKVNNGYNTVTLSAKQMSGRLYPEDTKYSYVPLMVAVVDRYGEEVTTTLGQFDGAYVVARDLHCPAVRLTPEKSPYTVLARGCDPDAHDRRIVISAYSEKEVGLELATTSKSWLELATTSVGRASSLWMRNIAPRLLGLNQGGVAPQHADTPGGESTSTGESGASAAAAEDDDDFEDDVYR